MTQPNIDAQPESRGERAIRFALYAVVGLLVLMALVIVDASIGHDGFHCELGITLSDKDDACGGFWD